MTGGHTRLLVTQTDERLLELVRQGHERAFEAIVVRYRRPLLAYCRRLGLSESRAEDALQQALLKAWVALQGGAEVQALSPWLYRIVHNTAINVIRSSRDELPLGADAAAAEVLPAPESELENASAARQALTHVAALPSMQRDAIILSALDGRSHEEVAAALGITSGAVRGLIFRARAALRSAAAALTPAPLINWASGTAGRAAPTAGRLAELTDTAGGSDVGGVLLKGAVVAGSAVLAAGVVLGPLHGRHASGPERTASPAAVPESSGSARVSADAKNVSAGAPSALARPGAANGSRRGTVTTNTGTAPSAHLLAPTVGHSRSTVPTSTVPGASAPAGSTQPTPTSAVPATVASNTPATTTSTASEAAGGGAAGGSGGGSGSGSGGGSGTGTGTGTGSGSETGTTKPESPSDDGHEGSDDGKEAGADESELAEHEREAAQERTERESELARERSEREAEIAREREHPDS